MRRSRRDPWEVLFGRRMMWVNVRRGGGQGVEEGVEVLLLRWGKGSTGQAIAAWSTGACWLVVQKVSGAWWVIQGLPEQHVGHASGVFLGLSVASIPTAGMHATTHRPHGGIMHHAKCAAPYDPGTG